MTDPFEDCETRCPTCGGSGRVSSDSDSAWRRRIGEVCDACDGLGVVLTERGEAMLAFIHRRIRVSTFIGGNP